jgi:N-acetylglutamate synthase-like GNAT family acetyltransferase
LVSLFCFFKELYLICLSLFNAMDILKIKQSDCELYQQERELRNEVLLRPIGLPDYGWEHNDKEAAHFVAVKDHIVVGCVLLVKRENNRAQLMQMAVKEEFQSTGVGKKLLQKLIENAKNQNIKEVYCHARENAIPFYLKNNFKIYDKPFVEVGVVHNYMKCII